MQYKKHTLKNGLRVILAPMKETETMTVMIMTGTGSRYETRENNGISHFLEHMFFKGTKKRPTALSISEELDAVGGEYNAFTGKDRTAYYAKVPASKGMVALDVVSDIFLNSKIDAEEIERERGAILQELNMYEDMPMRHIGDIFEELLYGDTPLGWEIIGPKDNIKTMPREVFIEYLNTHYKANNVVVAVAGKFDTKEVLTKIEKDFAHLSDASTPEFEKIQEDQSRPTLRLQYKKTDQTHMMLGVRAYDMFHEDRYALAVLAALLGGNMSSRLFIEVRERRGLAYNVRTMMDTYHDAGYLVTQCGIEHENIEKTLEVILKEYKKISEKDIPASELTKAKEYLKGKIAMGFESSDDVAGYIADQETLRKEIILPEERVQAIDKVTAADLQRVAKDIFVNEKLNLAVIGPHKDIKKLEKIVKF